MSIATDAGEAARTDLGSLRLHAHFDEGSGPVIVMLHGINSDGGDWRTVIDTIGPGYRFIAFDLLGFGASPKPLDIAYSADEHALVIANTLDDLGVDTPFLLVGYSLGGDIALRFASTWPGLPGSIWKPASSVLLTKVLLAIRQSLSPESGWACQ